MHNRRSFSMCTLGSGALLLAGLAGGCHSSDERKTASEVRAELNKLERPRPGEYSQTLEVTRFDVPGLDPRQVAQLRQMMERSKISSFCLTKEKSEQGFKAMFDRMAQNGSCSYSRFAVTGGQLDAQMNCTPRKGAQGSGTASIKMKGAIGAEGSDVTVAMDQSGLPAPASTVAMTMHMVTKRTGDCSS